MIARRNDGLRAGTIGHAQAGTQVVRIRHAIEYEQQGGASAGVHLVQVVVDRVLRLHRLDPRHHTLMRRPPGQLRQASCIAVHQLDARFLGTLQKAAHPAIPPLRIMVQLQDRLWGRLEPHGDGMEAKQDLVVHGEIVAAGPIKLTRPASSAAQPSQTQQQTPKQGLVEHVNAQGPLTGVRQGGGQAVVGEARALEPGAEGQA